MEAIKNGNNFAFEIFYNRFKQPIIAFTCRMVRDYNKAEELTQEIFFKILKKRNAYNPSKSKASSWLYKIAANLCIDEIRHSKFQVKISEKEMLDTPQNSFKEPSKEAEIKEKESIIKNAVNKLSPEHKTIIILHKYQGMKYDEIAEIMGKDFNWVKWHLKLTYEELEQRLKPYFGR